MRRRLATVIALLALAAPASATTIADVFANAESLDGQQVTVTGRVADPALGFAGESSWTLTDGEHRLVVLGTGPAPTRDSELTVTGKVGWKEGDEEFTWPPILHGAAWQAAK